MCDLAAIRSNSTAFAKSIFVTTLVICFTGARLRARRAASLSVARSPTMAAGRYPFRSSTVSVFSRKAVLPDPGA